MADYFTIATAETVVPMSEDEFTELLGILEDEEEPHGLTGEYDAADHAGYFYSEESISEETIPETFRQKLGALVARAGLLHLEFGVAQTCSRARPGSHGGYSFRILPDGRLVYPSVTWPAPERVSVPLDHRAYPDPGTQ